MRVLVVIPTPLTVVGGDDDDRPVGDPEVLEVLEKAPDAGVDVGDLSEIRFLCVEVIEGRRRRQRVMGVVVMEPDEEGFARVVLQPRAHGIVDPGRAPGVEIDLRRRDPQSAEVVLVRGRDVVVEELETLVKAEPGDDRKGADRRRRSIPVIGKDLGQGPLFRRNDEESIVPNTVPHGVSARQNRRVGRKGDRNGRFGMAEQNPFGRQAIDHGRFDAVISITPQRIGPNGVQSEDHDVERGLRLRTPHGEEDDQDRRRDPKIPKPHREHCCDRSNHEPSRRPLGDRRSQCTPPGAREMSNDPMRPASDIRSPKARALRRSGVRPRRSVRRHPRTPERPATRQPLGRAS